MEIWAVKVELHFSQRRCCISAVLTVFEFACKHLLERVDFSRLLAGGGVVSLCASEALQCGAWLGVLLHSMLAACNHPLRGDYLECGWIVGSLPRFGGVCQVPLQHCNFRDPCMYSFTVGAVLAMQRGARHHRLFNQAYMRVLD